MNANVNIYQINSDSYKPKTFLNVDHTDGYVGVWGSSYKQTTVIAFYKGNFFLYQFESPEYYVEWYDQHKDEFEKIIDIESLK
jgi:hypothetical protein